MDVPINTLDLLTLLKTKYPDKAETDPEVVGTPEYWKKIGIIELLKELEYYVKRMEVK